MPRQPRTHQLTTQFIKPFSDFVHLGHYFLVGGYIFLETVIMLLHLIFKLFDISWSTLQVWLSGLIAGVVSRLYSAFIENLNFYFFFQAKLF